MDLYLIGDFPSIIIPDVESRFVTSVSFVLSKLKVDLKGGETSTGRVLPLTYSPGGPDSWRKSGSKLGTWNSDWVSYIDNTSKGLGPFCVPFPGAQDNVRSQELQLGLPAGHQLLPCFGVLARN